MERPGLNDSQARPAIAGLDSTRAPPASLFRVSILAPPRQPAELSSCSGLYPHRIAYVIFPHFMVLTGGALCPLDALAGGM